MTDILYEMTASLPVHLSVEEGKGRRFSLTVEDKHGWKRTYNVYHPEQLYMHVDDSVFCVIIAKEQQEPGKIKKLLRKLIKGRPITETRTMESA